MTTIWKIKRRRIINNESRSNNQPNPQPTPIDRLSETIDRLASASMITERSSYKGIELTKEQRFDIWLSALELEAKNKNIDLKKKDLTPKENHHLKQLIINRLHNRYLASTIKIENAHDILEKLETLWRIENNRSRRDLKAEFHRLTLHRGESLHLFFERLDQVKSEYELIAQIKVRENEYFDQMYNATRDTYPGIRTFVDYLGKDHKLTVDELRVQLLKEEAEANRRRRPTQTAHLARKRWEKRASSEEEYNLGRKKPHS